jgi:hypothetical protein
VVPNLLPKNGPFFATGRRKGLESTAAGPFFALAAPPPARVRCIRKVQVPVAGALSLDLPRVDI